MDDPRAVFHTFGTNGLAVRRFFNYKPPRMAKQKNYDKRRDKQRALFYFFGTDGLEVKLNREISWIYPRFTTPNRRGESSDNGGLERRRTIARWRGWCPLVHAAYLLGHWFIPFMEVLWILIGADMSCRYQNCLSSESFALSEVLATRNSRPYMIHLWWFWTGHALYCVTGCIGYGLCIVA